MDKNKEINGIILVNKPQNWTSHDCVAVVRRMTGIKRVGHTGTLDPMATGVLPVCIGTTTRIMDYLDLDYKTYVCTLKLGITTDTEDIWGEVLTEDDSWKNITHEQMSMAVDCFQGDVEQIPPKYSALKVNGRKLYEYARSGQEVEIKSRKIHVKDIKIDRFTEDGFTFTVVCSKGTYVRTICKDIGEKLGCGATMTSLERVASGVFKIEDAITMDQIKEMSREEIFGKMYDTDYPLVHFGKISLSKKATIDFVNGKNIKVQDGQFYLSEKVRVNIPPEERVDDRIFRYERVDVLDENCKIELETNHDNMFNVYMGNEFVGVAKISDNYLRSDKVFNVRMQNEVI